MKTRPAQLPSKPKSAPRVSVVIPSWNGLEYLKLVLPSLKKQTLKKFETIVVDNGSDDGSVEYLRKQHPWVTLIALHENIGFAAGVNKGLGASRAEFAALINNDVELDSKWLAEMVAALERYPEAGSVTSCMIRFDERSTIDNVGIGFSWPGLPVTLGEGKPLQDFSEPVPVFAACGGGAMYRRQALKEVGLFDEDFFAYSEDVDWGFRAQLAGWGCQYVSTAMLYHVNGGTTKRMSGFGQRLWARNTHFVILKDYPFPALLRYFPKLVFADAKMLLGALKDGWFGTYVSAQLSFLGYLPRMLKKRWRIQKRRKTDMHYLNSVISHRFEQPSRLLGREDE